MTRLVVAAMVGGLLGMLVMALLAVRHARERETLITQLHADLKAARAACRRLDSESRWFQATRREKTHG